MSRYKNISSAYQSVILAENTDTKETAKTTLRAKKYDGGNKNEDKTKEVVTGQVHDRTFVQAMAEGLGFVSW